MDGMNVGVDVGMDGMVGMDGRDLGMDVGMDVGWTLGWMLGWILGWVGIGVGMDAGMDIGVDAIDGMEISGDVAMDAMDIGWDGWYNGCRDRCRDGHWDIAIAVGIDVGPEPLVTLAPARSLPSQPSLNPGSFGEEAAGSGTRERSQIPTRLLPAPPAPLMALITPQH